MSIQPITMTYGHVNIALLNILANPSHVNNVYHTIKVSLSSSSSEMF